MVRELEYECIHDRTGTRSRRPARKNTNAIDIEGDLYVVECDYFVAGVVVQPDHIVGRAAPIIAWTIGREWDRAERELTEAGYSVIICTEIIEETSMADFEGIVGVNMVSQYDSEERRIKFDNNPTWYGAPTSLSDDLAKGNKVLVRAATQGNNEFITHVKVLGTGMGKPSGGGNRGGKSNLSKEEWAAKDDNIRYQYATKTALTAIELLLSSESIKLGTGKKREEAFFQHLDRITALFYNDVPTKGSVVRIGGQLDEEAEVPSEVPDEEPFGDEEEPPFGE